MNYWRLKWAPERNTALAAESRSAVSTLPELTVPQLLNLRTEPGTHVVFMPTLQPEEKEKKKKPAAYTEDLRNDLIKTFCLPNFFFEHMGYDANGFFGNFEISLQPSLNGPSKGCATYSRFLSKQLSDGNATTNTSQYDWHYMGFATLWLKHSDAGGENEDVSTDTSHLTSETNIILCFDFDSKVTDKLINAFGRANMAECQNEPFFLLRVALGTVVEQFEADLDSFQPPVRTIEKGRFEVFENAIGSESSDGGAGVDKLKIKQIVERYVTLHEQSRHILHISETLGAASNNFSKITEDLELWMRYLRPDSRLPTNTARDMKLYSNLVSNLKLRADAFVFRMDNEIKCASNLLGVVDNNIASRTLKVTKTELKNLQFQFKNRP